MDRAKTTVPKRRSRARIVGAPGAPVQVPDLGAVYEGYRWRGNRPDTGR